MSYHNLTVQVDSSLSETKTFMDKDYLVVPVIAMVEGVRFGANQSDAELGLAKDFGKYPTSWNNIPLVVNHPKIDDSFVSASSVEVREEFSFGFTNAAKIEDKKLKLEAWIDTSRGDDIDEVQEFIDLIEADEVIEVSVGFFADVESKEGSFKGQSYSGIWRNIVPDHLALLTDEVGACSIEDGCGVPRLNKGQDMSLKTDNAKSKEACPCGNSESACSCSTTTVNSSPANTDPNTVQVITVGAVSGKITSNSVSRLLSQALLKHFKEDDYVDCWVVSYTAGEESTVVFTSWVSGHGYVTKGVKFNIDDEGIVTFEGDPFDVRIVEMVIAEFDDDGSDEQENSMSNQNGKTQDNGTPEKSDTSPVSVTINTTQPEVVTSATELGTNEPAVQAEAPKVLSREEAIASMTPEDQQLINDALAVQSAQKEEAIKTLKATNRCKFDDTFLQAQSLTTLNNLVELAAAESTIEVQAEGNDYSGRAAPVNPAKAPTTQSSGIVPAPKVFEIKKSGTAA